MDRAVPSGVRLAELIAALSLATDLGLGLPQEHVLRQTVVATRLAAAADLTDNEQAAVFYVSLLAWVGCVADSHEIAGWFGDDLRLRADSYEVDKTGLPMLRFMLSHVGDGAKPLRRITLVGRFLAGGFHDAMDSFVAHCQTTSDIAERLELPDAVRRALPQAFARWDGNGVPSGLRGAEIDPVMRIVQIADDAEVCHRTHGIDATLDLLRARSGTEFDPALVELCVRTPERIFGDLDTIDAWDVVIAGCADLDRTLDTHQLSAALETLGDYADLKCPWFLGHSRAVAALSADAARALGASGAELSVLSGAASIARLGVIGVSNAIWEKAGPLSAIEWERVRTVPYLTERVLSRQPRLAQFGGIAAMAHERMDGSGYPRGLAGAAIPMLARVLAAADVYVALGEARPHRATVDAAARVAVLRAEVSGGRLDSDAVGAVLAAAGHRVPRRRSKVAGLTEREAEVLDLLARGHANRDIAARLNISARTVGSHIEHIYAKIGVSTRGAAAMFAMRHGFVDATAEPSRPAR